MKPLFLGSHAAIDFLNTAFAPDGEQIETLDNGRAYLGWLVAAGLLDRSEERRLLRRFGATAMDEAAAEARKVREWMRSWLMRWRADPQEDFSAEVTVLNRLIAREVYRREVEATAKGLALVEHASIERATGLIARVAAQVAKLITQEDAQLVKSCAGTGCTLWFLDRTKAHRRLFCSASVCGNRAKVAAFRERARS